MKLDYSSVERNPGLFADGKTNMSHLCSDSQKGQLYLGVHQAQHFQVGEGGGYPILLLLVQSHFRAHKMDIQLLDSIQKRAVKMTKVLDSKM